MKLDRAAQKAVLTLLAEKFPNWQDTMNPSPFGMDLASLTFQAAYLEQHGLVEVQWNKSVSASGPTALRAKITAAGLDFLEDDGGLTAILGKVTVRLDADQWKELLASRIEQSTALPADERASVAKTIRELPAKAVEKIAEKMMDWSLEHAKDAWPMIQALLPHL